LPIADRIFARLRTMPASARSRRSSLAVNRATRSGRKPANAFRYAGRLLKMVDQESPACAPSSVIRSNRAASVRGARPHSRSWYARIAGSCSAHGHRFVIVRR